jgi:hypothetical protein
MRQNECFRPGEKRQQCLIYFRVALTLRHWRTALAALGPVLESQCPRLREILGTRCVSMLLGGLLSDWPPADDRRELRLLQGLDGYCAGVLEPYPFQILKDPARQLEVSCIDPLRKAAVNWV